ncbi:MAG: CehA/McbA family metallohydrolase [Coriobacteriales bacterium]|nr:CehA/McbA family metallohydrolase [Coriobacteriales bacterium]
MTSEVWGKADLHIHSDRSDGLAAIPEIMEYVQRQTDLSVIAITDHNTIEGAVEAHAMASDYDFEVIIGSEISSQSGHIIGLYLDEDVPAGLTAHETIARIQEQDGIAIIAHPFSQKGVFGPFGTRALTHAASEMAFHAFEVYNSLPFLIWANRVAAKVFALGQGVAATGGSDAHVLEAIGKGVTRFRGTTAEDCRRSIDRLETHAEAGSGGLSLAWRYFRRYPEIRRMHTLNAERCKGR